MPLSCQITVEAYISIGLWCSVAIRYSASWRMSAAASAFAVSPRGFDGVSAEFIGGQCEGVVALAVEFRHMGFLRVFHVHEGSGEARDLGSFGDHDGHRLTIEQDVAVVQRPERRAPGATSS